MSEFKLNTSCYLARLGLTGPIAPTVENLKLLTRTHLEAVPFENLQLYSEHREPSLAPDALYEKIVEKHRGGYCFELNKIFGLLLDALGYPCYGVAARVVHHRPEPRNISHRAVVATAGGKKWFCDVGFGGAGPKGALSMDTDEIQTVYGDSFRIVPEGKNLVVLRLEQNQEERVLVFRDEPWLDVDFDVLNAYYAVHPHSVFRNKRILYRCTADGWINLTENTFTTCSAGVVTGVVLEESQIPELLETRFGLTVPCGKYSENNN